MLSLSKSNKSNININHKKYFSWFTIVELIIVITILAILATIAFISFQDYIKDSRDTNRITTISSIEKWLSLYQVKTNIFPIPDDAQIFTWWENSSIGQWVLWESVSKIIHINKIPLDPKDSSKYVYSTFGSWQYYQIASKMENLTSYKTPFIENVYASNNSSIVRGNYKFDPSLPSLILVPSSVWTWWIFGPKVCFILDWWKNTFNECIEKKEDMNLKDFDNGLVGYWDMESLTNDWKLKDLSWKGNDWYISGTIKPDKVDKSLFWWAYYFWSWWNNPVNNWFVQILDNDDFKNLTNGLTISQIVKSTTYSPFSFSLIKTWYKSDNVSFITWSIDYSNKIHWYDWGFYITGWIWKDNISFYAVNNIPNILENKYQIGLYIFPNCDGFDKNICVIKNNSIILDWKYHQITATVDGKWNTKKLYIDWILYISSNVPKDEQDFGIRNAIWDLFIWTSFSNNFKSTQFNWLIDETKIYNRVLTDEEISQQAIISWLYGK